MRNVDEFVSNHTSNVIRLEREIKEMEELSEHRRIERNQFRENLTIALDLIHKLRQLNKWNKEVSDMINEALGKIDQNDLEVKKVP